MQTSAPQPNSPPPVEGSNMSQIQTEPTEHIRTPVMDELSPQLHIIQQIPAPLTTLPSYTPELRTLMEQHMTEIRSLLEKRLLQSQNQSVTNWSKQLTAHSNHSHRTANEKWNKQ